MAYQPAGRCCEHCHKQHLLQPHHHHKLCLSQPPLKPSPLNQPALQPQPLKQQHQQPPDYHLSHKGCHSPQGQGQAQQQPLEGAMWVGQQGPQALLSISALFHQALKEGLVGLQQGPHHHQLICLMTSQILRGLWCWWGLKWWKSLLLGNPLPHKWCYCQLASTLVSATAACMRHEGRLHEVMLLLLHEGWASFTCKMQHHGSILRHAFAMIMCMFLSSPD